MKKIRRISIVVAVILLGAFTVASYRDREPSYQGRALTQWIEDGKLAHCGFKMKSGVKCGNLESDRAWQCASHAFKEMASDTIPLLLNWVQAKDSPLKVRVIIFFEEHPHFHIKIQSAEDRQDAAQLGFMLLGIEAKPAWPVLIRWTYDNDRDRRLCALGCLARSKPDKETLVPVLLRLIHDPDTLQANIITIPAP